MSDGTNIRRVADIFTSDPSRRYLVVSAPGKRFGGDAKITDLLYDTHRALEKGAPLTAYLKVKERFFGIVRELGLSFDVGRLLAETEAQIVRERNEAFTASRGEYLAAQVMAEFLEIPFIDAKDVVRFTRDGRLDGAQTFSLMASALRGKRCAVIAGFYGADDTGRVHTFSRGGSDVTGAIVARAVGADLYENWTDVSGFLACDPKIVDAPARITSLSYRELRELSYMGANVLHSESIFPVREANIPILIKNTFRPEDEGTRIMPAAGYIPSARPVTGIAGKKDFAVIFIEKSLMNSEIGFARKILSVFERHALNFEHMPSGIDTISFVIDEGELQEGMLEEIRREICEEVSPDQYKTLTGIALIAVVGHGMSRTVGTAARLFDAIARAGVNVRMIDQGSSELNIIVGVDNENYERTVRAVYDEFFR